MALVARFVDSMTAGRTTRLDVNDFEASGGCWRLLESSRFDPPRAQRVRVSTPLADGAFYPSAVYDDRTLELRWVLQCESPDVVAGQLQLLARELDRPGGNFFEYQPDGASVPVFYRTRRLGLDNLHMPVEADRLDVAVNVPAESHGYGLRETLGPWTVANDPAGTAPAMSVPISGVKGDVAAPLSLILSNGVIANASNKRRISHLALLRAATTVPVAVQAETMTADIADTTLQANSPTMSGAGQNYYRTTFATSAAHTGRLHVNWPATVTVDARHVWRVYLRYRYSTTVATVITVQLRWGPTDDIGQIANDIVTLPAGTGTGKLYADLGLIQVPPGHTPRTDFAGTALVPQQVKLDLFAGRTSGTAELDWDVLLFVPADPATCRTAIVTWPACTVAPTDVVLDAHGGDDTPGMTVYARNASGELRATQPADIDGGELLLAPGANTLYLVRDVGSDNAVNDNGDDIAATTTVTGAYWPRYLYRIPS